MHSLYGSIHLLLSENNSTPGHYVQIVPKVSIVCVRTIVIQHCLNPLGHRIHQSNKGFYWTLLPLNNDITELVDVRKTLPASSFCLRMPHTFSIGFRYEDILGHTSPSHSASSERHLSPWRCVWVCYHVGKLPVSVGRGSCSASDCHSTYLNAFLPSMNHSSPVPAALMQP